MTVTISGSTGVAVPLGSASAPAETNTTSSTTGIYYPTSTTLGLSTNGTNAVYIDASQNVGIGLTYGGSKLTVAGPNVGTNGSNATYPGVMQINDSARTSLNQTGGLEFKTSVFGSGYGAKITALDAGELLFGLRTNSATWTESMRIQTTGNLSVNTTADFGVVSVATKVGYYGISIRDAVSNTAMMLFQNSAGATAGNIVLSGLTTTYGTVSDYRLKENVQPMTTGLATVSALKPVTYDWKFDGSQGEGFIAHELAEIVPYAVAGEKDAVNEDGSVKPQSVDYGKIVVHLVAAIKELSAEVEALKAKVGA